MCTNKRVQCLPIVIIAIIKNAQLNMQCSLTSSGMPVAVGWHHKLNIYCKLRGGNSAKTFLWPERIHRQFPIGWLAGTGRAEETPAKHTHMDTHHHPHPLYSTLPFLLMPHKVISLVVSFAQPCFVSYPMIQHNLCQESSTYNKTNRLWMSN